MIHGDGLGGSFDNGSIGRPSLSNGQKLFLKKQSGSYLRFSSARRSQLFPKQAIVREGGSCLPMNCSPLSTRAAEIAGGDVRMGTARPTQPCLSCRRSTGPTRQHGVHGDRPAQTRTRTSSADSMHRGSSMPISHWCKAATVHTASRCSFGIGVSSKSAMAPPDSSKIHATLDDQRTMGKLN